jgi:hypothetical protein
MLNKKALEAQTKAATLRLEGLQKLAEAEKLLADCTCDNGATQEAAEIVIGDPAPVQVLNPTEQQAPPQVALMLPQQARMASLAILDKIASELAASTDPETLKLAKEVDAASDALQKTAFVYQYDYIDPEPEMEWAFQENTHNEIPSTDGKKDAMKTFEKDISAEVTKVIKKVRPFSKV